LDETAVSSPPVAPETGARVDIAGASKHFGTTSALAGVHLHVEPGTFLVLLGPSGSGKTTLLRCLAGIERLSEGTIAIGGLQVAAPGLHLPPERRRLAMVFQDYALWPHMSALKNVMFPLRQRRLPGHEVRRRAQEMLERVGLAQLAGRYPNELSGGEQQRVALARALVGGTGLVLFDEPLSNLDADMREQLRLAISTLARDSGATSIYITHDQTEAFSLADKVGVLRSGRLVQLGTPEDLYMQPANPFVARFTGICAEMPVTLAGTPSPRALEGGPCHLGAGDGTADKGPRGGWGQSAREGTRSKDPGSKTSFVELRLPGEAGTTVTGTLPRTVPVGVALRMFVRPSAVQLGEPSSSRLVARVRDVAFAGRGYEHALVTRGGCLFTRVFCQERWPRGSTVGVRLQPEGCLVLPAEPGASEVSGEAASEVPVGPYGVASLSQMSQ